MFGIFITIIDFSLYLCNQYDYTQVSTVFFRLYCSIINMQIRRIYLHRVAHSSQIEIGSMRNQNSRVYISPPSQLSSVT